MNNFRVLNIRSLLHIGVRALQVSMYLQVKVIELKIGMIEISIKSLPVFLRDADISFPSSSLDDDDA